jgi:hypothetical protein
LESITISGTEDILGRSKPDAVLDHLVTERIRAAEPYLSLKKSLQGDAPFTLGLLDGSLLMSAPLFKENGGLNFYAPRDRAFVRDVLDAVQAGYLNDMRAVVEVAGEPPAQRRTALAELSAQATVRAGDDKGDPVETMVEMLEYSHALEATRDDQHLANEQVLLAAAAVLSIKFQSGSFPATLPGRRRWMFSKRGL